MRILRTIAITGVVLALAASLVPAQATCGSPQLYTTLSTNTTHVWTDGWEVLYYAPGYPPATLSGLPPVTEQFFGVFWSLGQGIAAYGDGVDAGTYTVPPQAWVYYGLLAGVYPKGAVIFGNWAQVGIDLCIATNQCECLLMTDERDGIGYYAIASKRTDANGNAYYVQPGTGPGGTFAAPIILRAIPAPDVTSVDLNDVTLVETWNVNVADVLDSADGVYELDGCDCGPNGYQIYMQTTPRGDPAPGSRNAADGWVAQTGVLPMGTPTSFDIDCSVLPENTDVYVATGLVFDSNLPAAPYKVTLSENFGPVECGSNLADPVDLKPKVRHNRRDVPRPERKR